MYSYLYENILFTNKRDQHCLGKESALGAIAGGERVVLIKSLISEDALGAQGCQVQLKSSADTFYSNIVCENVYCVMALLDNFFCISESGISREKEVGI